jgi:trans-aconitate methyltransferase
MSEEKMSAEKTSMHRTGDGGPDPDDAPRYSLAWLGLREPADAQARATELLEPLRRRTAGTPQVIHDLGCGSGSMGRWLAGRLPGPQHWVMYDQDPELLEHAAANMVGAAADSSPVTVTTRQADITRLTADDLTGATLVTASALLDLLTSDEVDRLAQACVDARCPALLTLSVLGRVQFTPADPLDAEVAAAFDAHQRRSTGGRRLLGPDAVDATVQAFGRLGVDVQVQSSPWRLGGDQAALTAEWLRGWVGAAYEQQPELAARDDGYLRRRLAAAEAGELRVVVHHADLFARSE